MQERLQDVLCGEVLNNESYKINKVDKHPSIKHSQYPAKSKESFPVQRKDFQKTEETVSKYFMRWCKT